MSKPVRSEQDIAKQVIALLSEWHYDIYQEVDGPGGRCDIVAVQGKILWAIECKVRFNLAVVEQAHNWLGRAHFVSVAAPGRPSRFLARVCRDYGIGILEAGYSEAAEIFRPRFTRRIKPLRLYDEQKTFCPAGSSESYFTPFKRTRDGIIACVTNNPGIEFSALLKTVEHHYRTLSTAKSCISKYIERGVIPGLRTEIVNRKLCIFPKPKEIS